MIDKSTYFALSLILLVKKMSLVQNDVPTHDHRHEHDHVICPTFILGKPSGGTF